MSAPFFAGCIGIQTNSGICKKKQLVQMQTWKEKKGNREKGGEREEKSGKNGCFLSPKRTGLHMHGKFSH